MKALFKIKQQKNSVLNTTKYMISVSTQETIRQAKKQDNGPIWREKKKKSVSRDIPRKDRGNRINRQGLEVAIIKYTFNMLYNLKKNINTVKKEMEDIKRIQVKLGKIKKITFGMQISLNEMAD